MGRGAIIRPGARLNRERGGRIEIGARSVIHPGAMLLSYGGLIRIGEHCSVNPYCVLYGHGGLIIGNHVRIAAHCVIIPANHSIALDGGLISRQPETRRGIRIGNDVWLGAGVRVLDGADIADGCVVAAGAIVRGSLAANAIYAGVPAKLVRMRKSAKEEAKDLANVVSLADRSATVAAP